MTKLLYALAGMVMFIGATTTSHAINIRCDSCSLATAKQAAIDNGTGEHFVFSAPDGVVRGFDVTWRPDLQSYWAASITVPSEIAQIVADVNVLYTESAGTMKIVSEIDGGDLGINEGYTDAYNVVRNSNVRFAIGQRLAQSPLGQLDYLNRLRAIAISHLGFTDGAHIEYVITFPDGSKARFDLTLGTSMADYLEGQSSTGDNEVIPEANSANWTGSWSGNNLQALHTHLTILGATIVTNGTGQGAVGGIVCTWDGDTLICTITWKPW